MRILVISNLLPPRVLGGYEMAGWNLAKGLRGRGHDVLVLTSPAATIGDEDQSFVERSLGLTAYSRVQSSEAHVKAIVDHSNMVSQPDNTLIVLSALRRHAPDHVVLFNPIGIGALAILDLLNRSGIPWTLNLGDRVPNAITEAVDPGILEIFGFADGTGFLTGRFAPVSETLREEIEGRGPGATASDTATGTATATAGVSLGSAVRVISRGVQVPAGVHRTRPYRDGGVTRFVSAGVLSEGKGVGLIIDAAAQLVSLGVTNFEVAVYGDGERDRFVAAALAAKVEGKVSFPGSVTHSELYRVHSGSDVFLFPTLPREPFGSAPIEAAAVGCVPILTATCGAAERLVDGVHCIKISRDARSLADAMLAVIDGSVDLDTLGQAATAFAAGPLSFDQSLTELEAFMLEAPPAATPVDFAVGDAVGLDVVERSDRALAALYLSLAASDAAEAEALGIAGGNRLIGRLRFLRSVVQRSGRAVVGTARSLRAVPTPNDDPDVSQRLDDLTAENEYLRKDNAAMRRILSSGIDGAPSS
jgi:glycosyltransferase involved in cell wall biosynthesis